MAELRARLLSAPRWVVALVTGLPFGAVMGVMTGLRHGNWTDALTVGAFAAVSYGAVMGFFMHRQFARYREALGSVPRSDVRKAVREARRGRVPADPEAKRAAYRVLTVQLEQLRSQRRWAVPFFVLVVASSVFLALTRTPAGWVAVALCVAFLAAYLTMPRLMTRRLELLRD
jgi:hypothetical protein